MSESKGRSVRLSSMPRAVTASVLAVLTLVAVAARAEEVLRYQVLTVAMGGHEVGTTSGRDVRTDRGFRFERDSSLSLKRGKVVLEIETHAVVETRKDLTPVSYRFEKKDSSGVLVTEGRVEGGVLVLSTKQGTGAVENRTPLPEGALFATSLEHLVRQQLVPGTRLTRPVIVEEMGAVVPMEVSVEKDEAGLLIRSRFAGLETTERVDDKGNTLLSETPALGAFAYPLGAAPPEGVKTGAVDVMARTTWAAPRLGGNVTRVRYRVHTPDAKSFAVPEDLRQKVVARTDRWVDVEVTSRSSTKGNLSADERRRLTAETPYEAAKDKRLHAAAARATRGAKSTREKVERLVRFVYEHVDAKALDRGYAPALTTLESKRGDCTEHSVLLSALLRSLGVPTRLVDGVVVDGGRAGYHEWVEVQLDDEGFVPADPTFGEFPASPARLKLAEGSSSPEGLLGLSVAAGRLLRPGVRVEVLDAASE